MIVLGSQNSSNSLRLAELAEADGKPAYLIDTAAEIQPDWFGRRDGAGDRRSERSEEVVEACVAYLQSRYGAEIESRVIREEHVSFPLPRELRMVGAWYS